MKKINEILLEDNQYISLDYIQTDEDGVHSYVHQEIDCIFKANEELNNLKLCSNINNITIKLVEDLSYEQN